MDTVTRNRIAFAVNALRCRNVSRVSRRRRQAPFFYAGVGSAAGTGWGLIRCKRVCKAAI